MRNESQAKLDTEVQGLVIIWSKHVYWWFLAFLSLYPPPKNAKVCS